MTKKCVLMFSGGLDSTTILAMLKEQNYEVYCLSFDYNQKHKVELDNAKKITAEYKVKHKIISMNLNEIGGSSLTDQNIQVENYSNDLPKDVPSSYVPARNLIFLSIALAYAETLNTNIIFCGANKSDYNNYPDCRTDFFQSFAATANLATKIGSQGTEIKIETPLIDIEKKEIIKIGMKLGVDYKNTISCYNPDKNSLACGKCLSCNIRKQNFINAGFDDQTLYQ